MSYFGSKFPEGISPQDYREIISIESITCPLFRRTVMKSLSSDTTASFNCLGCGEADAVRIVVDIDTERIFVRKNSACANGTDQHLAPEVKPRPTKPKSDD